MVDGKKIRKLREAADITQREMAQFSGVTQAQMSYIEDCLRQPTVGVLAQIAKKLGVKIDDLLKVNN